MISDSFAAPVKASLTALSLKSSANDPALNS